MALPFRSREFYGSKVKTIGAGTYGKVISTDKGYALKLTPNDDDVPEGSTLRDIISLLKVTSPYVVPLTDVIINKQRTTIVLPLADTTLRTATGSSDLNIKKIASQLGIGLAHIHNANMLHLDLKPDNVLLHNVTTTQEGPNYSTADVWITDLGLSRIHTCAFEPLKGEYFTLWYRPPEVLLGGAVSAKSDVWAYGVILAEMLMSRKEGSIRFLFPGDSQIDMLYRIFRLVGTPSEATWPGVQKLPNWNPAFPNWVAAGRQFFAANGLTSEEIDLVLWILTVDPEQRPTIFEVLAHPWFGKLRSPREWTCFEALQTYAHYPENTWLSFNHREIVGDWMAEVVKDFSITSEGHALAIYLLDRMHNLIAMREEQIQLYAIAALFIGSIMYDPYYIPIEEYAYITDNTYSKEQITDAVNRILKQTSFDLAAATSYFFLSRVFLLKPEFRAMGTNIWRASLLTWYHFNSPVEVADAILVLTDTSRQLTKGASTLRRQILGKSTTFESIPKEVILFLDSRV